MEYTLFKETNAMMADVAKYHDSAIVSFSGGKDSLVCLDLARKAFKNVVCFFMYAIPGLQCVERVLQWARETYKVEILQYPGMMYRDAIENRLYCSAHVDLGNFMRGIALHDIYATVMHDTGYKIIVHGAKEADSLWRRQRYFKFYTIDQLVHPLKKWRKFDVLSYCKMNNIPLPDVRNGSTGIDLSTPSILWMYDNSREDFERMRVHFPYIGAVVKRRKWYGVK